MTTSTELDLQAAVTADSVSLADLLDGFPDSDGARPRCATAASCPATSPLTGASELRPCPSPSGC